MVVRSSSAQADIAGTALAEVGIVPGEDIGLEGDIVRIGLAAPGHRSRHLRLEGLLGPHRSVLAVGSSEGVRPDYGQYLDNAPILRGCYLRI